VKECGFRYWEEVREMFGFKEAEKVIWNKIILSPPQH
jgi:hypothetical protein